MLHTSPSFSIFTSTDEFQDGEHNNRLQDPIKEEQERTVTIGDSIEAMGSGEFSFGNKKSMGLIEEAEEDEEEEGLKGIQNLSVEVGNEPASPRMYLAAGLGIDSFSIGGGELDGDFLSPANFDDSSDVEEYYRKMVDQYPCHPLFLKNYAQVLQVSLLFLIFSLLSLYINLLELHKIRRNYELLAHVNSTLDWAPID